ncbi:MAG: tRNA (adenosine(37)-N6)-threonylcarbamoyltransferase complex dimerization subunit type 1 TsaB [Candidatus Omnitrophica bacterium]|nr:tRNA (adenosine(37)-N6)-threonylcarbamoyltransferase complex dimerization subunit type 1 TsaB [Candidatus Omnitrophota bacterium]
MKRSPKNPVILAFDTSGQSFVAAVSDPRGNLFESRTGDFARHSEIMFDAIRRLLDKSKCAFDDLDAIAVGLGPGSFTGIRVGVTAAKVLAYACGARLIGIPSLEIIARPAAGGARPVCVVQDARRERVFTAAYQAKRCVSRPQLKHTGDFLFGIKREWRYTGDGMALFGATLEKKLGRGGWVRDRRQWSPQAPALMALALERYRDKRFADPMRLVPLYLYEKTCNVTKPKK